MSKTIVGAGAALVDLLIEESDEFVHKLGSEKGGMTLVEFDKMGEILQLSGSEVKTVPGGSACNTLVGLARLGGRARMIGRLNHDDMGKIFIEGITQAGVDHSLAVSESPTGRVLSIVTPDAQRTMFTFLGAAAELSTDDIAIEHLTDASIIHMEGYLLFNVPVVQKFLTLKKETGARLSLDLASFEVVEACRDLIDNEVMPHVDILIANEDEAKAYTGVEEREALDKLSGLAEIAIVKLGKKGALIAKDGEVTEVEAEVVQALDTTGAGDLWASGFLYGLTHNYSMANCGKLAARTAAEVVQVMGATIPEEGWDRIRSFRDSL